MANKIKQKELDGTVQANRLAKGDMYWYPKRWNEDNLYMVFKTVNEAGCKLCHSVNLRTGNTYQIEADRSVYRLEEGAEITITQGRNHCG